jgi:hypothetical protein
MEKIRSGGVVRVRNDFARMTDVNFSSLIQRIEKLEQQMKYLDEQRNAALKTLNAKKDKE